MRCVRGDVLLGCLGGRVPAGGVCLRVRGGWRAAGGTSNRTATWGSSSGTVHSQPPSFTFRQFSCVMLFDQALWARAPMGARMPCGQAYVWHLRSTTVCTVSSLHQHLLQCGFYTKHARIRHLPLRHSLHARTPECRRVLERWARAPPRRPLMPTDLDRPAAKLGGHTPSHGAGQARMWPWAAGTEPATGVAARPRAAPSRAAA